MRAADLWLLPALLGLSAPAHALAPGKDAGHKPHPHAEAADTVEDDEEDTGPREAVHVVKPGETLGGIANRAHVPRVLIIEANAIKPPYTVKAGDRLRLPRTRHHTVAKGETGFDIAYHYGVPWPTIATANGLDPEARMEPGQKLVIPSLTPKQDAEAGKAAKAGKPSADGSPRVEENARFIWPVSGKVVRRYAPRSAHDYHDGIDIAGKAGTAVRATLGGEVIFAGEEPQSFGKLVVIDHKNGWQSAYGFLDKITVKRGDTVKPHERIGLVGHTGKAPRDELHFELRKANRPVDPLPVLPKAPPEG